MLPKTFSQRSMPLWSQAAHCYLVYHQPPRPIVKMQKKYRKERDASSFTKTCQSFCGIVSGKSTLASRSTGKNQSGLKWSLWLNWFRPLPGLTRVPAAEKYLFRYHEAEWKKSSVGRTGEEGQTRASQWHPLKIWRQIACGGMLD